MPLEINQREREGITILELRGRITVGPEASAVRDKCAQLAAEGKRNIVLELGGVDFIDSTGLGTMVMSFTTIQKLGGALKLLNLSKRHIELLVLTKLSTIFEVFDDEQDAINSFFPDREVHRFDILHFVKGQEKT